MKLSDLNSMFGGKVSRLPVLNGDGKLKYIIHEARIDKYIAEGGKKADTLETFIAAQEKKGFCYGLNMGFVVVPEMAKLVAAKSKMDKVSSCQDIFITEGGTPDEPVIGWISNVRLARFLQA